MERRTPATASDRIGPSLQWIKIEILTKFVVQNYCDLNIWWRLKDIGSHSLLGMCWRKGRTFSIVSSASSSATVVGKQRQYTLLTLYQPMTAFAVMASHKPIRIYMEGLILGVNTLVHGFSFFKLFLMVGKELKWLVTGAQQSFSIGTIA